MFTRLKYYVRFEPANRPAFEFNRDFSFGTGMTAIIGPNERGKSITLEMIRFALFGAKALRGPTSGYHDLRVEAWFTLGETQYRIVRRANTAELWIGDERVARGTSPVNERIVKTLGFGLKVFDVTNSINQGAVEALSQMRPTERQKLVGDTVGLDRIDALIQFCNDEALALNREAVALAGNIYRPEAPTEPEGYAEFAQVRVQLERSQAAYDKVQQLKGQLSVPTIAPPPEDRPRPTQYTLAELENSCATRRAAVDLQTRAANYPVIDVEEARTQNRLAAATAEAKRWMASDRIFDKSPAEAAVLVEQHEHYMAYTQYAMTVAPLAELKRRREHSNFVDCPNCQHHFPLDPETVGRLDAEIAELEALTPIPPAPPSARLDFAYVEKLKSLIGRDTEYEEEMAKVAECQELIDLNYRASAYTDEFLDAYDPSVRENLLAEIEALAPHLIDNDQNLRDELIRWEADQRRRNEIADQYEAEQARCQALQTMLDDLQPVADLLPDLKQKLTEFSAHAVRMESWREAIAKADELQKEVEAKMEEAEQWREAKLAMTQLRSEIKQHLYPSLAKAASALLSNMTDGRRNQIEIDDSFEITVDGQPLNTLSGSAMAVSNLALRLGLGQVLTHKIFPVVLADEVDASMDDERAASTQDVLRQCARRVSQLLLVTHKKPEADCLLDLGEIE